MYDKFKNLGKIAENGYGSIISNRGSFSFFIENRDNSCSLPQVGKSIQR
jgi:hypothetical protein